MTEQHPITPPPELVKQWLAEFYGPESMPGMAPGEMVLHVAAVAARWGYEQRGANNEAELQKARDEELEACCEWLDFNYPHVCITMLRADRRPEPSSLKEQALQALDQADKGLSESEWQQRSDTIRRALNALPD